jgi:lysophospholipase L1-like esterase
MAALSLTALVDLIKAKFTLTAYTDRITAQSLRDVNLAMVDTIASFKNLANNPKGAWNASTNTPTLSATPSAAGDAYDVSVGGTQSITGTSETFQAGDIIKSDGTHWYRIPSVNVPADGSVTDSKLDSFVKARLNAITTISFKNTGVPSFATGPGSTAATVTFSNSLLSVRATDTSKFAAAVNSAEVLSAVVSNVNSFVVVGTGAGKTFFVNVAIGGDLGKLYTVNSGGSLSVVTPLDGFSAINAGNKIKVAFSPTQVVLTKSGDGITWSPLGTVDRAYGITSARIGTINFSTSIIEDLTFSGVVLTEQGVKSEVDLSSIDQANALSRTAQEFVLLADPASPSGLKRIPSVTLFPDVAANGNKITYAQNQAVSFSLANNPGGTFSFNYAPNGLLQVSAGNTTGTAIASAITDQEVSQAYLNFSAGKPGWIVTGASGSGNTTLVYSLNINSPLAEFIVINQAGVFSNLANVVPVTGAALTGSQCRIDFAASTIKVYDYVNGAFVLWATINKSTYGITRNVTGTWGAGTFGNLIRFSSINLVYSGNGQTVDLTTVAEVTNLDANTFVGLYSPGVTAGVGKTTLPNLATALGVRRAWAGKTIVLYMDSISSSYYPEYGIQLSAKTGATVISKGYPGLNVAQTADTTKLDDVAALHPDLIILLPGGNDDGVAGTVGTFYGASGETMVNDPNPSAPYAGTKYIEAIAYTVRYLNSKLYDFRIGNTGPYTGVKKPQIVLCNGLPRKVSSNDLTTASNNPANHLRKATAVREICDRYHLKMVDTFRGCGWDMSLEPYFDPTIDYQLNRGVLTNDGLHPNAYGYDRITDLVVATI